MSLTIQRDELHAVCTAISLISGGLKDTQAVFNETERLFGSAGLASMKNAFDRYCDGFAPLWTVNRREILAINVNEIWFPEFQIRKVDDEDGLRELV